MEEMKIGSHVRFHSPEYGTVEGEVVEIQEGLYGIRVSGTPGTFWRDRKALKLINDEKKVQK